MKKSLFAFMAAATFFATACGDDSSNNAGSVSRTEKCAASPKLSAACLVGKWTLPELSRYNSSGVEQSPESLLGAGTLELNENGTYSYKSQSETYGNAEVMPSGNWSVSTDSTSIVFEQIAGDYDIVTGSVSATMADSTGLYLLKSVFEARKNSATFAYREHFQFVQ